MIPRIFGTANRRATFDSQGKWGEFFALRRAVAGVFLAILLLVGGTSYGQSTGRGAISGTVTDSTGAAVVNAQVVVTDTATNVSRTSNTNGTGYFQIDSINPSIYKVTVTAQGFEALVRQGITVAAAARVNLPLSLKLGSTQETVVVTADADLLNTETASTGFVLSTRQVENLPAAGANPMQLATMFPGMQAPNSQIYSAGPTLSWNGVSKFGANGYLNANEWTIDGVPNMANPRGNAIQLSQAEVDEMKVEAVSFDAAYGHTMGAMITETTKSGTNQLHGTVQQIYTDRAWAAMSHFQGLNYRYQQKLNGCTDDSSDAKCLLLKYRSGKPGTHTNSGSYALGGPVFIPKVYDGRNKLFFFAAFDNNSWTDAGVNSATLPTLKERNGDFSEVGTPIPTGPGLTPNVPAFWQPGGMCYGTPYYGQYQVYNPYSVTLDASGRPSRTPFCGNVIPGNLLSNNKFVSLYNSLMPMPTAGNTTGSNYTYTSVQPQTFRQFTTREDYAVSQTDHLFFRYTRARYHKEATGFTIGNVDRQISPKWIQLGALGYDHVFNATTNLNVTVGVSDWKTGCCYYPGYQKYSPDALGLPGYLESYAGGAATLPIISISNYSQIGQTNNVPAFYRNFSIAGLVNHVQGKHSLRVGAEWRQQSFSQGAQGNGSGTYNFDSTYTQQNNGTNNAYAQSNWALSYAAFLMGIPTSASVSQGAAVSMRTPYVATYVADSWRITPKLTLLPGIRFEYEFGPSLKGNTQIVGWDPNATLPISDAANAAYQAAYAAATPAQQAVLPTSLTIKGGPMYAGVNGAPTRQFENSFRVLPRIGASYQLTPNTVIRAGYGIFSDTINAHNAGGSPHSGIADATGAWSGMQFGTNQDGYSTSTSAASSTTYGTNFVVGSSPLSNPFPTGFTTAIGNAAGAMYYLGSGPTLYDHNLKPAHAHRFYVGVQRQLGRSAMLEMAWVGSYTKDIAIGQSQSYMPEKFYVGGNQPNVATNTLMASQITNPFNIANFSALASSNAAAYSLIANRTYYKQGKINISNLVRAYPQMSGLSLYRSIGLSHFNEFQANLTKRYAQGLTLLASLQLNDQQDADYFANSYDAKPSWEPSNNSMPYRITAQATWELPFGKGKAFLNTGILSKIAGGFQIASSWERQAGSLIEFGNLFYMGTPTKDIKLKHPVYANNLGIGKGYNYIQWLNPGNVTAVYDKNTGTCTYTGTGFVTDANCQPNGYNSRVFPHRIEGLRQQAPDTIQLSVQRKFQLTERFSFEARGEAFNLLNRQVFGSPNTSPTSTNFGQITGDGGANGPGSGRWITIHGRVRF